MASKQNSKYITTDIEIFLRVASNIKKYSGFKPGDCIVDASKTKYIVSSIDEYGLIWVKQILASGKVSETEKTFCDWYKPELKIEEGQIDSIILGANYDPTKEVKEIAKIKSAMARRNKQKQIRLSALSAQELEQWIADKLVVGQHIWLEHTEYSVRAITKINVKDNISFSGSYGACSKCDINAGVLEKYYKEKVEFITMVLLDNITYNYGYSSCFNNHTEHYKIFLEKPEVYEDEQNR